MISFTEMNSYQHCYCHKRDNFGLIKQGAKTTKKGKTEVHNKLISIACLILSTCTNAIFAVLRFTVKAEKFQSFAKFSTRKLKLAVFICPAAAQDFQNTLCPAISYFWIEIDCI